MTDSDPLRLTVAEAARALHMSRAKTYRRIADGSLRAHRDGGQTFVSRSALVAYIAALEAAGETADETATTPTRGRYEYGTVRNPRILAI